MFKSHLSLECQAALRTLFTLILANAKFSLVIEAVKGYPIAVLDEVADWMQDCSPSNEEERLVQRRSRLFMGCVFKMLHEAAEESQKQRTIFDKPELPPAPIGVEVKAVLAALRSYLSSKLNEAAFWASLNLLSYSAIDEARAYLFEIADSGFYPDGSPQLKSVERGLAAIKKWELHGAV